MTAHVAIPKGTAKSIAIAPRSRVVGVPEMAFDSARRGSATSPAHATTTARTTLMLDLGKMKRVIAIAPKPIT